jgi:hypothetical protein
MIKSRKIRWAGHVARMGVIRNTYKIFVGKPEGKRPLRRSTRRWKDDAKLILEKQGLGVWIGFVCSGYGQVAGSREHGNETSGFIKGGQFLD